MCKRKTEDDNHFFLSGCSSHDHQSNIKKNFMIKTFKKFSRNFCFFCCLYFSFKSCVQYEKCFFLKFLNIVFSFCLNKDRGYLEPPMCIIKQSSIYKIYKGPLKASLPIHLNVLKKESPVFFNRTYSNNYLFLLKSFVNLKINISFIIKIYRMVPPPCNGAGMYVCV